MIASALVFALGALVATFVALVFAPILWSNAQRLARREFEATIPASVREMRGEIDAMRARAAFDLSRGTLRQRAAEETAARERAEAGRAILENGKLLARQSDLERQVAETSGRITSLEEEIKGLTGERDALLATRQELRARLERREGELAGLTAKHQALSETFDEQRFRLATAEGRIAELTTALRSHEAQVPAGAAPAAPALLSGSPFKAAPAPIAAPATVEAPLDNAPPASSGSSRLRAAIARTGTVKAAPPSADHADIRERIGDIAARVIHERIKVEGEDSQLARIIADAPPPAGTDEPLLADRVRKLQADELPPKPAPAPARKTGGAGRSRQKSRR